MNATNLLPAVAILIAGVAANYLATTKVDHLRSSRATEWQSVEKLRTEPAARTTPAEQPPPASINQEFDADKWIAQFVKKSGSGKNGKPKLKPRVVEKLDDSFDIDLAGAMEALKATGSADGESMPFFVAALHFAEAEPERALALAADENISSEFLDNAFASLAKRDLRLAWEWIVEHGHGRGEGMLHTGPTKNLEGILATHMADQNPAMFADFAVSFEDDQRLLDMLTFASVLGDREKIHAAWSALRGHESITRERRASVDNAYLKFLSWSEGAPTAARLLETELNYQDGEARTLAIAQIARSGQKLDAVEAANWLLACGDEVAIHRILPGFVHEWTKSDFNRAGEWLGRLPPSPTRDVSVAEFIRTIRHLDPAAAETWAETIQNAKLRATVIEEKN